MKKVLFLIFLISELCFAKVFNFNLSFIESPSRGWLSIEHIFYEDKSSIALKISEISNEAIAFGGSFFYHPYGMTGLYLFHSSTWIMGQGVTYINDIEYDRSNNNFWQLIFGWGYQHLFFNHFGCYLEMGFQFYAGNGSYYLQHHKKRGELDNEAFEVPFGFGLMFPF